MLMEVRDDNITKNHLVILIVNLVQGFSPGFHPDDDDYDNAQY